MCKKAADLFVDFTGKSISIVKVNDKNLEFG